MESLAVDPLDAVLVQKQAVQDSQATESVLAEAPQFIAVQEEMTEVQKIDEQIVLQELQLVVLPGCRGRMGGDDKQTNKQTNRSLERDAVH